MARRILTVTIDRKGRDFGKVFRIEEMPATQAERWATRAFLGMAKSGMEVPDNIMDMGIAGIAAVGIKALSGINIDEADILMGEMMACITIIPDPQKPQVYRHLVEDDTEEVSTLLKLKQEVLKLHIDHFMTAVD
jgi:hypothetical protein